MTKHISAVIISWLGLTFAQSGYAMSVEMFKQKLKNGEAITLIDVRNNSLYQQGHINNAINIPASIIERKRLPKLGEVIVYGDGIDEGAADRAVAHLNLKPGIKAEVLDGGYTGWSTKQSVVQAESGVALRATKNITYQQLHEMMLGQHAIILLDLRMGQQQESLSSHFPGAKIYDPVKGKQDDVSNISIDTTILAGIPKHNRQVLILIDDANGLSENVAEKLHAAGVKRLAILAGGEHALRTRGLATEVVRRTGD